MQKIKIILSLLVVGLALVVAPLALGQEPELFNVNNEVEEEIEEEVEAEDLDLEEPRLLPDSKFYFIKNWSRGIKSFFTFNKVKKAALKAQYASERLLEIRMLAFKNKPTQAITKATRKYGEELENVKKAVNKIADNASTNETVSKFLDKFTQHQVLHQNVLEKLETQVPTSTVARIRQTRELHIQKFGEVMEKLEDKTKIGERLETNFEELGNRIKESRSLEVLEKLEEQVAEGAKESIGNARQRIKRRIEERACITLYDPVCGEDGETYSNQCFAEAAGVEVISQGECSSDNQSEENGTQWIQIESIEVIGESANPNQ